MGSSDGSAGLARWPPPFRAAKDAGHLFDIVVEGAGEAVMPVPQVVTAVLEGQEQRIDPGVWAPGLFQPLLAAGIFRRAVPDRVAVALDMLPVSFLPAACRLIAVLRCFAQVLGLDE